MDKTVGKSASGASSSSGAPSRPWLVRKRGGTEVLQCADLVTLRTWMLERRLTRDDEVSRGGQSFRRMGSIIELESLFHSVDVERAQARRASGQHTALPSSGAATARGPARTGTPQGLPALSPAAAPASGGRSGDAASIGPMKVTPLGITPAPGGMSPLRATPSGQPAPKRPQPAMPGLAGSVQAAQRNTPPSATPDSNKGRPKPPPKTPAGVVPQAVPAAVADSLAGPLSGSPSGRPAPAASAPSAQAPAKDRPSAPPAPIGDRDEDDQQPTQRMEKLDPKKLGPAPATTPQDSGSQTVVFRRGDGAGAGNDEAEDAEPIEVSEPTRRLPPATPVPLPATGDRTIRLPPTPAPEPPAADPIAEAILKNDPVPRHLKEPTDSSRIVRGPTPRSLDMTERIEKKPGPSLLTISLGVAGALGLVYYLSTRGGSETTTPQTDTKAGTQITQPETKGNDTVTTPPTGETKPVTEPNDPKTSEPTTAPKTATPPPTSLPDKPATSPTPSPATAVGVGVEPTKTVGTEPKTATPPATNPPATATGKEPATTPGKEPVKAATPGSEPVKTATGPGTEPKTATPPATNPPATAAKPNPPVASNPPPTAAKPTNPPTTSPPSTGPSTASPPTTSSPTAASTRPKKIVVTEIPKTFDGQMELAQRLVEAEQFDDAQRMFETMLPTAGHVAAIHVGLGKCALETGRPDTAITHYQDALKRAENYGPAIFGLAKAYRSKGDKAQAITYYKRYLVDHPTGGVADVARAAIAKLEGQPAPAPEKTPLIVQ